MQGRIRTDVIVLGSGVAGLTAALSASLAGLRAVIVEHTSQIGGTSARSSGTVWIPGSHLLRAEGVMDDREKAGRYLASLVGDRGAPEMWRAFLDSGPAMLEQLEREAGIAFRPFMSAPDYRQDHPGAAPGGRALEPLPFDGRLLGADFARLAPPLPELMLFGGMMITRAEAALLVKADRSPAAVALGARLVGRYLHDRLHHRRGTRLVLGNALVARLLKAVTVRGNPVLTNVQVDNIEREGARISGVRGVCGGKPFAADARAVVLAGGGFPADAAMRQEQLPEPVARHTPAADGCDGSTIQLGLAAGGALGPGGLDNALWFPSSIAERSDGTTAVYPHIMLDRAKPGMIAVDGTGRRFVNEAVSYHEFVRAMYRVNETRPSIPAWLICDRDAIRRYGLGLVRPRWTSLRRHVGSGYLAEGSSLDDLAEKIGVPADTLMRTVTRYNDFARTGMDADFGKGETIYERANGDPDHRPNPCIGALAHPPFYAVALHPTPLGTSRGLVADRHARVLDPEGRPIEGLYVCGNDMHSAFGGEYPGAGGQLGQAMTFAWIAAHRIAGNHRTNTAAEQTV